MTFKREQSKIYNKLFFVSVIFFSLSQIKIIFLVFQLIFTLLLVVSNASQKGGCFLCSKNSKKSQLLMGCIQNKTIPSSYHRASNAQPTFLSVQNLPEPTLTCKHLSTKTQDSFNRHSTESKLHTTQHTVAQSVPQVQYIYKKKEGIRLSAIVFQMNLDEDEKQDELSVIIDELFDKYDSNGKGHLDIDDFLKLVKDNSKDTFTEQDLHKILGSKGCQKDRTIDKLQLFQLCLPSVKA